MENLDQQHDSYTASGTSPPDSAALNKSTTEATQKHYKPLASSGFKNRTKGEAFFNALAYTGVGYFGVTSFSVFMTWLLRDSKSISPYYSRFTEATQKAVANSPLRGFSSSVYSNMTILALFIGGTIVSVFPVKWLEDGKSKIVKGLDKIFYGKDRVKNDPEIKSAHAEMDAVPQQTWASVFWSRVVAFGVTMGIFLLMGSKDSPVGKATNHSIDSISTRLGRGFDRFQHEKDPKVNATIDAARAANDQWFSQPVIMRADPANGIVEGNGVDRIQSRIYSYISLDAFYTVFTSVALFVSTRMIAPLFKKPEKPEVLATPKPANDVVPKTANDEQPVVEERPAPQPKVQAAQSLARLAAAPVRQQEAH